MLRWMFILLHLYPKSVEQLHHHIVAIYVPLARHLEITFQCNKIMNFVKLPPRTAGGTNTQQREPPRRIQKPKPHKKYPRNETQPAPQPGRTYNDAILARNKRLEVEVDRLKKENLQIKLEFKEMKQIINDFVIPHVTTFGTEQDGENFGEDPTIKKLNNVRFHIEDEEADQEVSIDSDTQESQRQEDSLLDKYEPMNFPMNQLAYEQGHIIGEAGYRESSNSAVYNTRTIHMNILAVIVYGHENPSISNQILALALSLFSVIFVLGQLTLMYIVLYHEIPAAITDPASLILECSSVDFNIHHFSFAFMAIIFAALLSSDIQGAAVENAIQTFALDTPKKKRSIILSENLMRFSTFNRMYISPMAAGAAGTAVVLSNMNILLNLLSVLFILFSDKLLTHLLIPSGRQTLAERITQKAKINEDVGFDFYITRTIGSASGIVVPLALYIMEKDFAYHADCEHMTDVLTRYNLLYLFLGLLIHQVCWMVVYDHRPGRAIRFLYELSKIWISLMSFELSVGCMVSFMYGKIVYPFFSLTLHLIHTICIATRCNQVLHLNQQLSAKGIGINIFILLLWIGSLLWYTNEHHQMFDNL